MIQAIALVLDLAPEHWSSGTRMVAIALADYANTDTGHAWPSISKLARRTGLSERQVQRHLRVIELDGWIVKGPERQGTTLWIWAKRVRLDDRRGDMSVTGGVTWVSPLPRGRGVTPMSPKPLLLNHHENR